MAMKRLLLTLMLLGASLLIFAQDYPFSVVKSGTGKQAVIFIPILIGKIYSLIIEVGEFIVRAFARGERQE